MSDIEAEPGEVVHDLGEVRETGWFVVCQEGYLDVENALWNETHADDYPWSTEHFEFTGALADLVEARERLTDMFGPDGAWKPCDPPCAPQHAECEVALAVLSVLAGDEPRHRLAEWA